MIRAVWTDALRKRRRREGRSPAARSSSPGCESLQGVDQSTGAGHEVGPPRRSRELPAHPLGEPVRVEAEVGGEDRRMTIVQVRGRQDVDGQAAIAQPAAQRAADRLQRPLRGCVGREVAGGVVSGGGGHHRDLAGSRGQHAPQSGLDRDQVAEHVRLEISREAAEVRHGAGLGAGAHGAEEQIEALAREAAGEQRLHGLRVAGIRLDELHAGPGLQEGLQVGGSSLVDEQQPMLRHEPARAAEADVPDSHDDDVHRDTSQ